MPPASCLPPDIIICMTPEQIRLFQRYMQKRASLAKRAGDDLSLDQRPALEPPAPKEKPPRKPARRRVFPFKRYKLPELK